MNFKSVRFFSFCIACLVMMIGCKEDIEGPSNSNGSNSFNCDQLSYSDTIFYISATENILVNPQVNLQGQGTFDAIPNGLAIDSNTGVIDVNASETGLKYKVTFTPTGSSQICETFVTIGGVNYSDGVYVLDQNQILAGPIYNGVPGLPLPCPDDDDDDSGSSDDSCDFDVENPTGQLLEDLGFEISSKGVFDLLETVENGTFGNIPTNGEVLDVELFYTLPDLSANALNSIPLRFFYYETVADIPQSLLDDIEEKSELINELRSGNWLNFRVMNETRPARAPRPPFIVIVARLE
ncbi:MAG: hypothetical protein HWE15_13360 [Algoriphagus sp.]|uniref:hypothetical protein n=1 Tax=Algoriphagus sp. TaxID=1872435 RepID=UPI0017BC6C56|nr:hypothetical protein [Algoriphagus sp.]NVJ87292.1 hypothetical protein [Algoriphagus sp.]